MCATGSHTQINHTFNSEPGCSRLLLGAVHAEAQARTFTVSLQEVHCICVMATSIEAVPTNNDAAVAYKSLPDKGGLCDM